ncbi:MAG TPA: HNH endonuclease signature motif containing protein, partial [Actinomycetota bacterium]
ARRLACNARIQMVLEDEMAQPIRFGRLTREPSAAMMRQLRYRDRECRFPGCGSRRFTHAHHIEWWSSGGRTDLDNLVLVCSFHHRLVHEHGWKVARAPDGTVTWLGPGSVRRRAGPPMAA